MLSSVSTPSGTASRASAGTPGVGQVVAAGLGLGELVAVGLAADGHDHRRDAVLVQRASACSSRASKIDDGTPLYCAEPSTTIASDAGRESCRAVHQMRQRRRGHQQEERQDGGARRPWPPASRRRTPTRHGYHDAADRPRRPGDGVRVSAARRAPPPSAARPASSRATGTRNGEQDT